MEREKKKRNSILRSSALDEKTSDSVRTRRRISFSKRKSVREFCASEETKAWNTSYDVSDPKNHSNETVGEKSVNGKHDCLSILQTTQRRTDNESNEKENDQIISNINNQASSGFSKHRDSIALPLRNSSPMVVESSLEITLTEKERHLRLNNKAVRNNLSFTLVDYEADNFCRTQSLTMEAEKTDCFRHELEDHIDDFEQNKQPTTKKIPLEFTSRNAGNENNRCPESPNACDMDISVPKLTNATNIFINTQLTHNATKNYNVNDSMDIMESTPCAASKLNQQTLHINEDIGTPPSLRRETSSRRTIIFDSEEPIDAMNISHGDEGINADVSIKEAFTIRKENEDMDLSDIPKATTVIQDDGKEKKKLTFKHISVATPTLLKEGKKESSNVFRKESNLDRVSEENNTKPSDFKPKFMDKNAAFWNLDDDNKNDSTLFLANVTLDSDPTLSEYMLNSSGGQLNYRQLNDELEKGRIKLFSGTPTPVKKQSSTPLSTGLRINLLKSKVNLPCIQDMPENPKHSDDNLDKQPRTPLRKGRAFQLGQETPHRSLIEFEQIELEVGSRKTLPALTNLQTHFFDNISLNLSKLDSTEQNKEKTKSVAGIHEPQNLDTPKSHDYKELPVYESKSKNENNTMLASTDMEVEDSTENCFNDLPNVQENKKENPIKKRLTLLVPEKMTIDESFLFENKKKNLNTPSPISQLPEKEVGNLNNDIISASNNECPLDEVQKSNFKSKTNCLTVSAIQKMVLEDCEPLMVPDSKLFEMQNKNTKTKQKSNKRQTILSNEPIQIEQNKSHMKNEVEKVKLSPVKVKKSNKRQTILSNDPIEIEEDEKKSHSQMQNEPNSNKRHIFVSNEQIDVEQNKEKSQKISDIIQTKHRESHKRQTVFSNESIIVDHDKTKNYSHTESEKLQSTQMQNDEILDEYQFMQQNLTKSNEKQAFSPKEPMEIEEEKNQKPIQLNSHKLQRTQMQNDEKLNEFQFNKNNKLKSNKRQTILSNDPIQIEDEKFQNSSQMQNTQMQKEEDEYQYIKINKGKSNKRQTLLSNEPIEIEEEIQNSSQMQKEGDEPQSMQQNLRKSDKRQTMLSNELINFELEKSKSSTQIESYNLQSTQKENEEEVNEYQLIEKSIRKSNKRQTMISNKTIEIEQEKSQTITQIQSHILQTTQRQILTKSNKRQTILPNEPIEIEPEISQYSTQLHSLKMQSTQMQNELDNESQFMPSNLKHFSKRQTMISNEPIQIEEDQSQTSTQLLSHKLQNIQIRNEEQSEVIQQNSIISHKQHTMISSFHEPMEIELEKTQNLTEMDSYIKSSTRIQSEEKSESVQQNLLKSNKRQTMHSNEPIEVDQDNNKKTFRAKQLISSSSHLLQDKNQTQYNMDESIVTEHGNCNEYKKRYTMLASKGNEMDDSLKKTQNIDFNENIRAAKHKRCTLRDDLNISLESSSPVSKIRNIEIGSENNKRVEQMDCSIYKSPNRVKTSQIPVLISSAVKKNKSQSIKGQDQTQGELSSLDMHIDTLPLPRRCLDMSEDHLVPLNTTKISVPMPKSNLSDLSVTNNFSRFNEDLLYLTRDTCSLIENETLDLQDSHNNDNINNNDNNNKIPIVIEDDKISVTSADDNEDYDVNNLLENLPTSMKEKTFELPKQERLPDLEAEFAELRRLREKTKISDVFAHYRRISMGLPLNLNDVTVPSGNNTRAEESDWFTTLKDRSSALMAQFDRHEEMLGELNKPQEATIDRLCKLINEKSSNWRINLNMQFGKRLIFYHKRLPYASYLLIYKEKYGFCGDIEIIQLKRQKVLCKKNWKPIDYVLDFQLQLEEPHNLMNFYKLNDLESICETMCKIDECCTKVKELGIAMWRIVLMHEARLIRIENNTYVELIVHRRISEGNKEYPRVEKIDYLIELHNLREICFKNLFKPRPYAFREEFQVFHKGLEFLQIFLDDPERYLK